MWSRIEAALSSLAEDRSDKRRSRWVPSMTGGEDTDPRRARPDGSAVGPGRHRLLGGVGGPVWRRSGTGNSGPRRAPLRSKGDGPR